MYNVLIIGCGNIGALYDFKNDEVLTHAKAFFNHPDFQVSIFDIDKELQLKIATFYKFETVDVINEFSIAKFDCISICVPTNYHYKYLSLALQMNIKIILCEKPISLNLDQISKLESLYKKSTSKVVINFIRRFQTSFIELRNDILDLLEIEALNHISIRYQKGFMNNCSHAIDTINFLLNTELNFTNVSILNPVFDFFIDDPTISLFCKWKDTSISITGINDTIYSFLEIDLFFQFTRISISNGGRNISISKFNNSNKLSDIIEKYPKLNCLNNYMLPVIDEVYSLLKNKLLNDNFMKAIVLNKKMLSYIN